MKIRNLALVCLGLLAILSSCDYEPSKPWKLINTPCPNGTGGSKYVAPDDEPSNGADPDNSSKYITVDKLTELAIIGSSAGDVYVEFYASAPIQLRVRLHGGVDFPFEIGDEVKVECTSHKASSDPNGNATTMTLIVRKKGFETWSTYTGCLSAGKKSIVTVRATPLNRYRDYGLVLEAAPAW